nr:hypothetical protein [Tanacetum cinerariifolium]
MSLNQFMAPSSVVVTATARSEEMTPLSSIATVEMTPSSSPPISAGLVTCGGTTARKDTQYKKLLDALVKMVIEEFYSLQEEKNMTVKL